MANQALIQGAYTSADKFSNAGSAFSQAFEARTQQFNEATKIADAKREELFSLVDNIELDDLGNTPGMTAAIMSEAKNAQNEYYEKVKNTNPFDPELRLEANKSSQKINQLQALSATHQAFVRDFQANSRLASDVNDSEQYDRLKSYLDLTITKDSNGEYAYKDKSGNIISRKDLASYNDSLLEIPVTIYEKMSNTAGTLLTSKKPFEAIKPQLKQMLSTYLSDPAYGDDFLFDSLGGKSNPYDVNDPSAGLRLSKYAGLKKNEILDLAKKSMGKEYANPVDFLKDEVVNGYMTAFEGVHSMANPVERKEATQSEINRAEANKTKEAIIKDTIAQFSNAVGEKDINFLTGGRSIVYKGKTIKNIESNPDGSVNLVYDIGQEKEGAFDKVKLSAQVIDDLLSSYTERNFKNFDDDARLELSRKIRETYKGGVLTAPDPYAEFIRQ